MATRIPRTLAALTLLSGLAGAQVCFEVDKLLADDGAALDLFGGSVAADDGAAVVGAWFADDLGPSSGAAYLFDLASGAQVAELSPGNGAAGDFFGRSVALGDGLALVGARHHADDDGAVYRFDAATGAALGQLLPSGGDGEMFGQSVAVDDGVAAVGAIRADDLGPGAGAVYLFDAGTGAQLDRLLADDGQADDQFGVSVAVSAGRVLVGAPRDDDGGTDAGAAYLFDAASGAQLTKLVAGGGGSGALFGWSVALDGDTALVGAHLQGGAGAAYLFDVPTGALIAELQPGAGGATFGWSVDLAGGVAVVGGYGGGAGGAWLFDADNGAPLATLAASDATANHALGRSVGTDGDQVVVGATGDDESGADAGAIYVFDAGPGPWVDLGLGLAGANGVPSLQGCGPLLPGTHASLSLTDGAPGTSTTVVIGLSDLSAPFKGGVLVPNPDVLLAGLVTDGDGSWVMEDTWPQGIPSGLASWWQVWMPDAAGPAGFSASNALTVVTP
jgi:hypothetical protein